MSNFGPKSIIDLQHKWERKDQEESTIQTENDNSGPNQAKGPSQSAWPRPSRAKHLTRPWPKGDARHWLESEANPCQIPNEASFVHAPPQSCISDPRYGIMEMVEAEADPGQTRNRAHPWLSKLSTYPKATDQTINTL